ncbi:hypothetical protein EYF80_014761 [Liparis tanakae]|uniref:Uncharacterized protein n=1 Tax=Liparis tanakae TaxID=230148 RepID=A0A4Z2IC35_9TELE|nr:hypothetical protein EYF80_014761 [Liparis tanakae]
MPHRSIGELQQEMLLPGIVVPKEQAGHPNCIRSLPLDGGGLLHVSQHIRHQCVLQPFPHAVHQLLLFPTHTHTTGSGYSWQLQLRSNSR